MGPAQTRPVPIEQWATTHAGLGADTLAELDIPAAFEILVSRCEQARRRGAADPLRSISPRAAGGNSRLTTRGMLAHLGYSRAQLRIIHRVMGGSTGGWPGLLRLFVEAQPLTTAQRVYLRKQVRAFTHAGPPAAERHKTCHDDRAGSGPRSHSSPG